MSNEERSLQLWTRFIFLDLGQLCSHCEDHSSLDFISAVLIIMIYFTYIYHVHLSFAGSNPIEVLSAQLFEGPLALTQG